MKRISTRERRLAFAAITLLVLAFLYQGAIKPIREKLTTVTRDLAQRRLEIEHGRKDARDLAALETNVNELTSQRKALVVKGSPIPEMMRRVEIASKNAGIRQVDMRPSGQESIGGHTRYKMQLEAKSPFPSVSSFIYYLEGEPRPLVVDRIEISTDKGGSDTVRSTIVVSAYTAGTRTPSQGGK